MERVSAVSSAAGSSARNQMMEVWRMSMMQKVQKEMQDRITGRNPEPRETRRVEPAVRVEISSEARRLSHN